MSLITDLQKLDLTEKEARTYLACLELGEATVQKIASKADINRATAYVILDTLIKKGLCSTFQKEKKTYFVGQAPEALETMFVLKQAELAEKEKYLRNALPQLKAIYSKSDKPVVRFYEGKEGLMAMINEQFEKLGGLVRMFYPADIIIEKFTEKERQQVREKLIGHKTSIKSIYTSKIETHFPEQGTRMKIPQEKFPISSDIALFDGKVRIASLGDKLSGVIIQDPEIYKTMVTLFELAWLGAKSLEDKKNE